MGAGDPLSKRAAFDRSLVEGPLGRAVWKLAWPTLIQNLVAGLQGIVDHVMVGHYVGFQGNAAIGVAWQIFLVVVVFIASLAFTDYETLSLAKSGIVFGSLLAALAGIVVLRTSAPSAPDTGVDVA